MPKQEASATTTVPPSQKNVIPIIHLPLTFTVCATVWPPLDSKLKKSTESTDKKLDLFKNKPVPDSNISTKQSFLFPENKLAGLNPTEIKEPNRSKLPWRKRILVTPAETLSIYSESFFITPSFDTNKPFSEPPSNLKPPPDFIWSRSLTRNEKSSDSPSSDSKSIFNTNDIGTDTQEIKEPSRSKLPWRKRILVTPAETLSICSESFFITPSFDTKTPLSEPPSNLKPPPDFIWSPLTRNQKSSESPSSDSKSIFNTNDIGTDTQEIKEPNRSKLPWRKRILVTPAETLSIYSESFFITPSFDKNKPFSEPPFNLKPPPDFLWSRLLTRNENSLESPSSDSKSIFNTNDLSTDTQNNRTYFFRFFNSFKTDDSRPISKKSSAEFSQFRPPQVLPESPAPYSKLFFSDHFTDTEQTGNQCGWKSPFPRSYAPLTPSAESSRKKQTSIFTQTSLIETFCITSSNTSIAEKPEIPENVIPTAASSGSETPSEREQSFKFPWSRAICPDLSKTLLSTESESPNVWANTLSKPNLSTDIRNRSLSLYESAVEGCKSKMEWFVNNRSGLVFFALWYLILAIDCYMNWWPGSWLFTQQQPPTPPLAPTTQTQSTTPTSESQSAST